MKSLIVLFIALPFCLSVELKFFQTYGTGIKKIEIPSCSAEPCALVKGTPLDVFLTVEAKYPPEKVFKTVSDFETSFGISGYRDRFVYYLAESSLYCKHEPNQCPLKFNNSYEIKRQLFLSKDTEEDINSGFGSKNGKTRVNVNVVLMAHDNVGTVNGDANIVIDIKAPNN